MSDLYTDADPVYRATKTHSGVPPPSLRDFDKVAQHHDGERGRPDRRSDLLSLDMHVSTDYLKCAESQRLSIHDLIYTIRFKTGQQTTPFWDMPSVSDKLVALREKVRNASPEAQFKSNPYERISKAIFMNREATKLAALDATFDLTRSRRNETFTFADVCGGPGGFTEYLLWRIHSSGGSAKGYGITLKADSREDQFNWHTEKFRPDVPLNFVPVYGEDGTGDIYKSANIREFGSAVRRYNHDRGVDLVVADGDFDFTAQEKYQEHLAQRLILCEVIAMLTCLKSGGNFVCKFFDTIEYFTADLIWVLYQVFDMICITKPLSSQPTHSERYLICKGLRTEHPTQLISVFLEINQHFERQINITSFVPGPIIESDESFVEYVKKSNWTLATKQIEALEQLERYTRDPQRPPMYDQEWVRRTCLKEWRLPVGEQ